MDIQKNNRLSARALTLADLDQQSLSDDMDQEPSQFQPLGIDISNIQAADTSNQEEFSKSLTRFSKKHSDSTTNADLTQHLMQFKQKIIDMQHEIRSEQSDPYEMSLHSFKNEDSAQNRGLCVSEALPTNIRSQNQQKNQQQQYSTSNKINIPNTSLSSGGLSFQPPHLNSTNNQRMDPIGNLLEQLEYHRIKYYDSYMPEEHKVLNNPLKYLKYKIHQQTRYNLNHCLDCLIH